MYVIEVFERIVELNNALIPMGIFTKLMTKRVSGDPLTFVGYDNLNEKYANPYTTVFKTKKGAENKIEYLKKKIEGNIYLDNLEFQVKALNEAEEISLIKSIDNNNTVKIKTQKNYIVLEKEQLHSLEQGKELLVTINGNRYIMLVR